MKKKFPLKYIVFKNIFDRLFAFLLIIILSPLLISISLILLFEHKGRFIFSQERPGYRSKMFRIYKFKTMNDNKNHSGNLLEDMKRITYIGSILRQTSLDELPSLFNILMGEMSFVGPRPLLKEYLMYYSEKQSKRHFVKPGLTGWAQINGRNSSSWEKRLNLDVWYVNNFNFFLDSFILVNTIWKVITQKNINKSISLTMPKFSESFYEKK